MRAKSPANPEAWLPTIEMRPSHAWALPNLREVWQYRELLFFLVWRDVQGDYRRMALGMTWVLLRPAVYLLVSTLVFGGLFKIDSGNVPYPLFSLAALIPWIYFTQAITRATYSLNQNINLISKVYFPRTILPLMGVLAALVDFAAASVLFGGLMLFYGTPLRPQMLLLPVWIGLALLFALALGFWLSALTVKYRDLLFALAFMLQGLMYASPVVYPLSLVPERWRLLYQLNPMTSVIQGVRWALLGTGSPPGLGALTATVILVLCILLSGSIYFHCTERTLVDLI